MGNRSKRVIRTQKEPFNLDALEQESRDKASEKNFKFTLGGKEFSLPPFGQLDRKVLTNMNPENPDSIMDAFRAGLSEKDFKEFDEAELSIEGLNALEQAWSEHSGMSAGE